MDREVTWFKDLIYSIKARCKLIVLLTLIITLISAFLSFFVIQPEYEASTKLFIGKEGLESSTEYTNGDVELYQNLMATYSEIIQTKDLVSSALNEGEISVDVNKALKNLTVNTTENTQILEIKYISTDPYEANNIVKAISNEFVKESKQLIPNGNVQVIQQSQVPVDPVSPNIPMNIAIAFFIGFVLSLCIAFLLEYFNNSFKNKEELEVILGIPVIGAISVEKK